jgi:uncharacterized protein
MSRSSAAHRMPAVDAHGPLVLALHELGRRAGSMRRVQRTVPAPADWALELVRVPAGADVELDLRLEAVMDGVLVSGTISTELAAECGRCLEPVRSALVVDVQELFAYAPDPDDEEIPTVAGEFVDFTGVARDAVVLALPVNPLCAEDCSGLCPGCGSRLADLPADHDHDVTDPRWSALRALQTGSGDTKTRPTMGS